MRGQILLVQTQDGNPTDGLPPGSRRGSAVRTESGRPMEAHSISVQLGMALNAVLILRSGGLSFPSGCILLLVDAD
jgi:hypothetical protein